MVSTRGKVAESAAPPEYARFNSLMSQLIKVPHQPTKKKRAKKKKRQK